MRIAAFAKAPWHALWLGLAATAFTLAATAGLLLVYALLLAPGHDGGFYQGFAARVSPFLLGGFGLVAHGLAGRSAAVKSGFAVGLATALPYPALDVILTAVGGQDWLGALFVWLAILVGAAIGAWTALRRALDEEGEEAVPPDADPVPLEPAPAVPT